MKTVPPQIDNLSTWSASSRTRCSSVSELAACLKRPYVNTHADFGDRLSAFSRSSAYILCLNVLHINFKGSRVAKRHHRKTTRIESRNKRQTVSVKQIRPRLENHNTYFRCYVYDNAHKQRNT